MVSEAGSEARARAAHVVRRFARATNLLVAGRRAAVVGEGPDAAAIRSLLARLGVQESTAPLDADYLFYSGEGDANLDLTASRDSRPLVVVEARPGAIDRPLASRTARPGVVEIAGNIFLVSADEPDGHAQDPHDSARMRIAWAGRFMPVSAGFAAELADERVLEGTRIGVSMVLEPKTAVLALLLREAGARVSVYAHPDETDEAVAAALAADGLPVFAESTATRDRHKQLALAFLDEGLELLIDDGSHLIRLAHLERPSLLEGTLRGAAEETTSGLRPLRAMDREGALRIPVIAVNDARSKTLFDNRWGTGQSCVFAIADLLETLGRTLDSSTVVVAGFGPVGEGVAQHAAAFGADVIVAETDPVRALQASFNGYRVAPLVTAVAHADLVISATGIRDTISLDVLRACAVDTVVAVAGGVPQEIAIDDAIAAGAHRESIAPKIERFTIPGAQSVLILDDGGCINITAGEGNPIEIMDLSFAVQLAALRHLAEHPRLGPGLHELPTVADDRVAERALVHLGYSIDTRTATQDESVSDWSITRFGSVSGRESAGGSE